MSRVAVIGEEARVRGFALAGALVFAAEDAAGARAAWRSLPADVAVAVLTPRAAGWLQDVTGRGNDTAAQVDGLPLRPGVLPVVMPPEQTPDRTMQPGMTPADVSPRDEAGPRPPGTTPAGAPPR